MFGKNKKKNNATKRNRKKKNRWKSTLESEEEFELQFRRQNLAFPLDDESPSSSESGEFHKKSTTEQIQTNAHVGSSVLENGDVNDTTILQFRSKTGQLIIKRISSGWQFLRAVQAEAATIPKVVVADNKAAASSNFTKLSNAPSDSSANSFRQNMSSSFFTETASLAVGNTELVTRGDIPTLGINHQPIASIINSEIDNHKNNLSTINRNNSSSHLPMITNTPTSPNNDSSTDKYCIRPINCCWSVDHRSISHTSMKQNGCITPYISTLNFLDNFNELHTSNSNVTIEQVSAITAYFSIVSQEKRFSTAQKMPRKVGNSKPDNAAAKIDNENLCNNVAMPINIIPPIGPPSVSSLNPPWAKNSITLHLFLAILNSYVIFFTCFLNEQMKQITSSSTYNSKKTKFLNNPFYTLLIKNPHWNKKMGNRTFGFDILCRIVGNLSLWCYTALFHLNKWDAMNEDFSSILQKMRRNFQKIKTQLAEIASNYSLYFPESAFPEYPDKAFESTVPKVFINISSDNNQFNLMEENKFIKADKDLDFTLQQINVLIIIISHYFNQK